MATERTLVVNIRKDVMKVPPYKRAKKAVSIVRKYLQRHMKSDDVKIGKYLNMKLWERGIKNPAHKITMIAKKDDKGRVTAELPMQNIPVKKAKADKTKEAKTETKTA